MNLLNKCTINEIKLLENAGIAVENREYSNEELNRYGYKIEEYIMSHSTKNNEISKLSNQYRSILDTLTKES